MSLFPMPFKKLHADIKEKLETLDITEPTAFESKSIPVIKSGANVFCMAPKNSGKTTTIILTTLQKLKFEKVGNAARAMVLVENMEQATELNDAFLAYTRHSSLRLYLVHEKSHIDLLKSEIFKGVDILIATPLSIHKLLLSNGLNISSLTIFSVDDAEFLAKSTSYSNILAITQSIKKCQFVLYSESIPSKLKSLDSYFMEHAKIVSV